MGEADSRRQWELFWRRERWLVRAGRSVYNRWFLRALAPLCGRHTRLLEVGCGTSSLNRRVAERVRSVTGVDLVAANGVRSRDLALEAGRNNCHYVAGDGFRLPFAAGSFDVVWSQGLLEHHPAAREILAEKARVCRSGGLVVSSVPYRWSYLAAWYAASRLPGLRPLWLWPDQRFHDAPTLRALVDSAGIQVASLDIVRLRPRWAGILLAVLRKA